MSIYKILHNKRKIDISCSTFGSANEFAIVTVSDITEIKKIEKEKQSLRFQNIYFHSMAHNVRTPMNSIFCANENLKMCLDDPQLLQMVSLSESASYILMMMFEQVEDLNKLKFNKLKLTIDFFDIRQLLLKVFDNMRI